MTPSFYFASSMRRSHDSQSSIQVWDADNVRRLRAPEEPHSEPHEADESTDAPLSQSSAPIVCRQAGHDAGTR